MPLNSFLGGFGEGEGEGGWRRRMGCLYQPSRYVGGENRAEDGINFFLGTGVRRGGGEGKEKDVGGWSY